MLVAGMILFVPGQVGASPGPTADQLWLVSVSARQHTVHMDYGTASSRHGARGAAACKALASAAVDAVLAHPSADAALASQWHDLMSAYVTFATVCGQHDGGRASSHQVSSAAGTVTKDTRRWAKVVAEIRRHHAVTAELGPLPPASHASTTTTAPATPAAALSLLVEPQAGMAPLYAFMASAHRSLDMTMYELSDPRTVQTLIADHQRGVSVRVLLDRDYSGASVNQGAYSSLQAAGVSVAWANDSEIFHQKTITVDGDESAIMTGNLTSRDYATTRDFVVMDSQPADVAAIESVFASDWADGVPSPGPSGADLVWSPESSAQLVSLIDSANHSLTVENEEMDSSTIEQALTADAARGVSVTVVMTASSGWDAAFSSLEAAGVHVVQYPDTSSALYIHAKVIDVDGRTAFVGSQNFSTASLDYNRELGIITSSPAVLRPLGDTLLSDASLAQPATPIAASPPATTAPATAPPPASTPGTTAGCYIDPEGNCYRAGEYCPDRLHGQMVQGEDGPITCEDVNGWYWESS
jgi:cardiolipin synthase A/B